MDFVSDKNYEIGLSNGLNKSTIYNRVYNHMWSIEKAITVPLTPLEYRARKHPKKYTDKAIENGISLCTFYTRLKKGWSYEKSSTVPVIKRNRKKAV